MSVSELTF